MSAPAPNVAIYYNTEIMTQHYPPGKGFAVEEPARIVGIEAALKGYPVLPTVRKWRLGTAAELPSNADSVWSNCTIVQVSHGLTDEEVAAAYGKKVLRNALHNIPASGARMDPRCGDIYWSVGTWTAAKLAAASAIQATQDVLRTGNQHAFCIVRPPGHHCFDMPAGFCILNNVVLAARKVLEAGKRVAVIDWDYHYGDGTAAALWGEDRAMFVSLHAAMGRNGFPTYPSRTARDFKGTGLRKATRGRCFNIQWEEDDADDAAYAYAFNRVILPALQQFAPDVILISAGYDAIRGDTLAGMELTVAAFGYLAAALTEIGVPVVGVLEGGYSLELLAAGVRETIRGLLHVPEYTGESLKAWLAQEPQPQHRTIVEDVRSFVLGAGHDLEG